MSTHNICFCGAVRKILCEYPLLSGAVRTVQYTPEEMKKEKTCI